MSTNYYFRFGPSSMFGPFKDIHIGKYACQSFGFHGIKLEGGEKRVDIGSGVEMTIETPRLMLTSAKEWKEFLEKEIELGGTIHNEYGWEKSNLNKFIEDCWDKPSPERRADFMNARLGRKDNRWVDSEGYCFSGYEFS